jgi:hypothetical protein
MGKKTWKANQDATAGMQVTDGTVQATVGTVNGPHGVFADESGVYLRGKLSLMAMPEQIRVGGLWSQQSGWIQMFPSTMAFPVPNLLIDPPLKGVADMATAVGWMMGLLL